MVERSWEIWGSGTSTTDVIPVCPNKGHMGIDDINQLICSLKRLRFSSLGGSTYIVGNILNWTVNCVFSRNVYHTLSLFGRDHYWRFYCMLFYDGIPSKSALADKGIWN